MGVKGILLLLVPGPDFIFNIQKKKCVTSIGIIIENRYEYFRRHKLFFFFFTSTKQLKYKFYIFQ